MKKLSRLIWVLHKCRRASKENEDASSATGDSSTIIMLMVGLCLVGAMFFAGRFLAQHQAIFGDGTAIFSTIMMLAALVALFLSIPTMINQLYMSGDLDMLVTMPFTPMQIVAAKLVNASLLPLGICCGLTIPTGIGFGVTAGMTSPMYWLGLILAGILLSITAIALAGLVVILIMRLFRRIRSRNVIAVMTALFTFGLTAVYFIFASSRNSLNEEQLTGIFQTVQNSLGGVARIIPMIDLNVAAMVNAGAWAQLLLAIAATAVTVALLLLAAKFLYFDAALGMQDANAARATLNDAQMTKATRASGIRHAMVVREFRTVLRIPAMINNGYLQSFILPLLMFVPMGLQLMNENFSLDSMREVVPMLPPGPVLIVLELLTAVFVSIGVGMSSVSSGIISREGKDYYTLKAMPVPMRTIVAAKLRVAALINCIPSVGYPTILVIVCTVLGITPAWCIAAVLAFGIPFLYLMVSFCAMGDVAKPNLNWENEADVCKNNTRGVIAFVVALFGAIGVGFLLVKLEPSELAMLLAGIALLVANAVGAGLCYLGLMKAADELPKKY